MKLAVGDIVLLDDTSIVEVWLLHSGHYDFQYTGKCVNSYDVVYFDDSDIVRVWE